MRKCALLGLVVIGTVTLVGLLTLSRGDCALNLASESQDASSEQLREVHHLKQRIQVLERRLYLNQIRSFRLSGELECNDVHVQNWVDPAAFKCLPAAYRSKACMGGQVTLPAGLCDNPGYVRPPCSSEHPCRIIPINESGTDALQLPVNPPDLFKQDLIQWREDASPVWKAELVEVMMTAASKQQDIGPAHYPGAAKDVRIALETISASGEAVFVMGSISPWIEVTALQFGVANCTTVDYNTPVIHGESPNTNKLRVLEMRSALQSLEQWRVLISFSSIEHDGLGRYGDPLDPDGDLVAMKEAWLKLEPGGHFLLAVPVDVHDQMHWYSARIYGPLRLPLLLQGWEYMGLVDWGKLYSAADQVSLAKVAEGKHQWDCEPVLILRKPVDASDTLDATLGAKKTRQPYELACSGIGQDAVCARSAHLK